MLHKQHDQSHVQANLYGMGRDPRIFADPLKFRPERWLRGDVGDESMMAMASLPFGHGARMCIGMTSVKEMTSL